MIMNICRWCHEEFFKQASEEYSAVCYKCKIKQAMLDKINGEKWQLKDEIDFIIKG